MSAICNRCGEEYSDLGCCPCAFESGLNQGTAQASGYIVNYEWTSIPPTEQGWYWHWNGDADCAPFPTSVLYSGTSGKCFVSAHSGRGAVDCDKYGGFWQRLMEPPTPKIP